MRRLLFLNALWLALLVLPLLPGWAQAALEGPAVEYSILVQISPSEGTLSGQARIELPERPQGGRWLVDVRGMEVISATLDGKALKPRDGYLKVKKGSLLVAYSLSAAPGSQYADPANPGVVAGNLISTEGVALTGGWYPEVEGVELAYFSLKALLPQGYEAVSEAEEITVHTGEGMLEFSFLFPYPVDGVTLAAGPYRVYRAEVAGIEVYGYFLPEDEGLAEDYVREAVRFIDLYSALLGKYPYTRFSVVENILPTGYSMPTYTLLGRDVLRLPFILSTSLGHEVLHQWFGSGVYADGSGGNWSEGLTAYLADHYYEELKGAGAAHRKRLMLDYNSYVRPEGEFALEAFRFRTDRASRSIGYGKGAMVFHMLKMEIGEEAFFRMLGRFASDNRFRLASWLDIRAAAEEASGSELGWFFDQWVGRKGHIHMHLVKPTYLLKDGRHIARFVLEQEGEPYRFRLPVTVSAGAGAAAAELVDVAGKKTVVEIEVPALPVELVLDPGYDLMRDIGDEETPPLISAILGARRKVFVLPADGQEALVYAPLAQELKGMGFEMMEEGEVDLGLLRKAALVVPGAGSVLINSIYAGGPADWPGEGFGEGFVMELFENPFARRMPVARVFASSVEQAGLAAPKLSHYGRYSRLRFAGGSIREKSVVRSQDGMRHLFETSPAFVRTDSTMALGAVMDDIEAKDVIFVGESHNSFGDHKLQLSVIREMVRRGHKVAVGMEMFEPKGQAALDQYVAGSIDEGEFLEKSRYYDSWGMNYYLYREILDYARLEGLPVLGLNQEEEIVKKVSRAGLGALDGDEMKRIPSKMDMSDTEYSDRLRVIFFSHNNSPSRDFTSFYQAQVLRDEAMAHNIAGFMEQNPGHKVVVVVGQGHVAYGSGIPRRLARINGSSYSVLVNADSGSVDPQMADYVFYAPPTPVPETPILGVSIKKAAGGVGVQGVMKGGLAERAGLLEGDLIVSVGQQRVASVPELKIALFGLEPGERVTLTVLRKRVLFGPKEMVFPITVP